MAGALIWGAASVAGLMLALWIAHLYTNNASIVDPGWSLSLALLAVIYPAAAGNDTLRGWLMAALAVIWGVRLGVHLLWTRVIGHPEEGRYEELRRRWGGNLKLKFLLFFQFQALLALLLSVPFLLTAAAPPAELTGWEYAAIGMWVLAMAGESAADRQLQRFRSSPENRGRTCRAGLWKYSRHPNYFFEWLIWIAYALYAFPSPHGYLAFFSPLLILYFLFRVTGIPATEAQALRSKGEDYRRYQRTTSAFVPWFPKEAR